MQDGGATIFMLITLSILFILLVLTIMLVFNKRKSTEQSLNKKMSERESYRKSGDNLRVNEMPDDPDEAMVWLENMAKDQETKNKQ
jgi:flagellar basal body-associated protein FliL